MSGQHKESEAMTELVRQTMECNARGTVLRSLFAAPCYTLNAMILRDLLDTLGMHLSHDRLDAVLTWLQDQQLVRIERNEVTVVTITSRGADVAQDRTQQEGISRPQPL
jgi:hypothetical protein